MSAADCGPVALARAEAWRCSVPMDRPVRLGEIVYPTRDYVVLRVTREDGVVGQAIGYTRGTPLLEAVAAVVTAAAGVDVSQPAAVHDRLARMFIPGWGQLVRGVSLLDIALWDAAAQTAGLPLHLLLGATADTVPMMVVAGYHAHERGLADVVAETAEIAARGFGTVKLLLSGGDPDEDLELAGAVRAAIGPDVGLGVDFHAAFRDVGDAALACEPLRAVAPRFVEDPFPASERRSFAELSTLLDVPLAAGEDVPGLPGLTDLLPHIGFLRLDATVSGGITTALRAIDAAQAAGVTVQPHIFPYVHAVLAAARPAVAAAEVILPQSGADPIGQLLAEPFPIAAGRWELGEGPGLGLAFDLDAVQRHADATWNWSA